MDQKTADIRKEGRRSLNRDEGSYTLNHTYDRFLATSHLYRDKPEEELNKLLLMKVSVGDRNVKVKMLVACQVIVIL